jgi:hypothetical protein
MSKEKFVPNRGKNPFNATGSEEFQKKLRSLQIKWALIGLALGWTWGMILTVVILSVMG